MNKFAPVRRRLFRAAASAAVLTAAALASPALAQDGQPQTVGEVVVTAQFREQSLQQTPLAITAVNAESMEMRSQTNLSQVAAQAPNVTLKPAGAAFGSAMVAFIRGVGQTDFNFSQEPGVGIYVDDVYHATLTGSLLDLVDLERVEILRGPQGTLAGRNAIGGAIKLYSKKPTGEGGGYVEATYGGLNRVDIKAMADFTIVPDKLFMRISGASRHRDGYVDRVDYKCTHPSSPLRTFVVGDGCKLGEEGGQAFSALRAAFRFTPSERVEINLSADVTNDRSPVQANTLLFARPNGLSLDGVPYDSRFVPFGPNQGDPNQPNDPFLSYATFIDPEGGPLETGWKPLAVDPINHYWTRGASATIDIQITDNLALKSVTGYRKFFNSFAENTPASPIGVQLLLQTLHHRQWTEELRLNGQLFDDRVDFTLGGFYVDQDGFEEARVDLPYVGAGAPYVCIISPAPCGNVRNFAFDFIHGPDTTPSTSKAVFAHVDFHVTDRIDLIGGVRYSKDKKVYTFARRNPDGTLPCGTPNLLDPLIPGCANWLVAGLHGQGSTFEGDRWDYRVAADFKVTDDFMLYAQVATGFKSGGQNARPFFPKGGGCPNPDCQVVSFDPETLTAYEAGFKSYLLDRRVTFNAAAFFNKYTDIILLLGSCPDNSPGATPTERAGQPCALPANVGSADVKGAEFELIARPIDGLLIDGSLSYLDFEYTEVNPITGVNAAGVPPFSPKWKWSFGVQYELPVGDSGTLTPRLDVSHQSDVFVTALNGPTSVDPAKTAINVATLLAGGIRADRISGYTVANARVTWRSGDGDWMAALEVTNLTNKLYYHTYFDLAEAGLPGYTSGQPAIGRQWAVTVRRTF